MRYFAPNKKENDLVYQISELIPGFLTWLAILAPIWLTLISPRISVLFITFIFVYVAGMGILFLMGLTTGYLRYRNDIKTNWLKEIKNLDKKTLPDQNSLPKTKNGMPFFAIIVPSVADPVSVLKETIQAIVNSKYPKENYLVVMTLENKDPVWANKTKKALEKKFSKRINLLVTLHNLKKEHPPGAAANRRWAALQAEKWLKENEVPFSSSLLLTFDNDTIIDPLFLPAIAHRYLITKNRKQRFFTTAAVLFDNNIWNSHLFSRILSTTVSIQQLANWVFNGHMHETFSIFAINFESMKAVGYWDPYLAVDDSPTSVRLFFHFNGNFSGEAVNIPVHLDSVAGTTFFKSHDALYKQQRRWGWGTVIDTSIILRGFSEKIRKIPIWRTFHKLFIHFFRINIITTSLFTLSFGISFVRLFNTDIELSALITNIATIMKIVLGTMGITIIPLTIARFTLFKKIPKSTPLYQRILFYLEMPLFVVGAFVFTSLPYIESQTRPFFNRGVKFESTKKLGR